MRQRLHTAPFVGQFAAVQVAPQTGAAINHQANAEVLFGHTDFVSHDGRQVCVEDIGSRCTAHHIKHAELNTAVEEQAELPQEADFRRV